MKKLLGSLLISSFASMSASAMSECGLNDVCDMANAPFAIKLEKGKTYTCNLNLNNRELTTLYRVVDANRVTVDNGYVTLSHFSNPPETNTDITIDTSKFTSNEGQVMFSYVPGFNLGYETVHCSEK